MNVLLDHRLDNAHISFERLARDAPGCRVYTWPDEQRKLDSGYYAALHAKCAIADGRKAFVSSANLTGHAMDHNLEVGYLVTGGPTPGVLSGYLDRLVVEGVLELGDGG